MANASRYRPWTTASTWFMTELCSKSSGSKRRKRMPLHGKTRIADMIHMLCMTLETTSIGLSRLQQEKQALNKRLTFKSCIVRMKKVKLQESRETCQKMLGSVARLSRSSTGRKTRCTLIWNLLWEIKRQKCKLRCTWEATINRRWLRLRAYIHHQRRDLLRLVGRALQRLKAAVKRIEINRELRRGSGRMKKRTKSQPLSQASTTVLNRWQLSMAGQSETKVAQPKAHPSLINLLHLKILNQQRIIWIAQAPPQTLISTLTMHLSNSNSKSSLPQRALI